MASWKFNSSAIARTEQAEPYSSNKNAYNGDNSGLRGIKGDNPGPIFEDPRNRNDRRQSDNTAAIPEPGCRRRTERRSDRLHLGVWWMKRNYCVDRVASQRNPASKALQRKRSSENKT